MANFHNSNKNNDLTNDVEERLLNVAEELFSQQGFDGTSVRDITTQASCNVAAVNYHFSGKDNLYVEVFRRRMAMLRDNRIASIEMVMSEQETPAALEKLLRAFANAFLKPFVDRSKGRRFLKLMAREMVERHLPKSMFAEVVVRPVMGALQAALTRTLPGLEESKAQLCILSVVGQLVHWIQAREIFHEDTGAKLPIPDVADVIEHIVKFSVAGIEAYSEEQKA